MRARRWVVGTVAVLVALTAAGWWPYVHPRADSASASDPADAIIALGGSVETAFVGQRLFQQGVARNLVISDPYGPWEKSMQVVCPARYTAREIRMSPAPQPTPGVTCFTPHPGTTRGEAMAIGQLARHNGWDDVIVLAPTFHLTRARIIVGRCYSGRLRMVDPHNHYGVLEWPYQYVYQTSGFVKVALRRGC